MRSRRIEIVVFSIVCAKGRHMWAYCQLCAIRAASPGSFLSFQSTPCVRSCSRTCDAREATDSTAAAIPPDGDGARSAARSGRVGSSSMAKGNRQSGREGGREGGMEVSWSHCDLGVHHGQCYNVIRMSGWCLGSSEARVVRLLWFW